jgi:hypothetical protein
MVRKYGKSDVLKLVQAYAKGDSDDEAFQAAFGVDVAAFDDAFMTSNNARATKYGPQPAPTGVPGGAVAPGSTPAPAAGNPGEPASLPANRTAIYILAGVMAVAGLALMGAALAMVVSARSRASR